MDFGLALMQMHPDVHPSDYELMQMADGTIKITRWDRSDIPQPLESDIENYWNNSMLPYWRSKKKADLQEKCNEALVGGFTSSALGTVHTYPSHAQAQANFNTELNRFLTDPTYTSCKFYTEDAGFLVHTKDQLTQAFHDGHDFGNAQWAHLFDLFTKVDDPTVTTQTQLDGITW